MDNLRKQEFGFILRYFRKIPKAHRPLVYMADTGQRVPSYLMHGNEQNICTYTKNIKSQQWNNNKKKQDINYSLINIRHNGHSLKTSHMVTFREKEMEVFFAYGTRGIMLSWITFPCNVVNGCMELGALLLVIMSLVNILSESNHKMPITNLITITMNCLMQFFERITFAICDTGDIDEKRNSTKMSFVPKIANVKTLRQPSLPRIGHNRIGLHAF